MMCCYEKEDMFPQINQRERGNISSFCMYTFNVFYYSFFNSAIQI